MAHAGDVIRNPVTGETVTFLETAAETDGRLLRLEMASEHAAVGPHQHPKIAERWDLQEGTVRMHVAGREHVLTAPAQILIPAATPHDFASDGPMKVTVDLEPAGDFEGFMETVYALARDGKTNDKGVPNLLQAAVIGKAHLEDYALVKPALWLQRIAFAVLAPVGRLFGYRATYP